MKKAAVAAMDCAVAQTLDVIGDWWTLLILRNAFHGMRTFDNFQTDLGISTSVLSQRLKTLCTNGVLEKRRSSSDGRSFEYRLTDSGLELYPILIALMQWGERYRPNPQGVRVELRERVSGKLIDGVHVLARDGRRLGARDVTPVAGPGADDQTRALLSHRGRRPSWPDSGHSGS